LYCVVVFILDALAPLGIEVWVLNLPVILVPVVFRNTRTVVLLSMACSTMLIVGSVVSPPGPNPQSWDILNRGMGLTTIWMTTVLAVTIIKRSIQLDDAICRLRREIAEHGETSRTLQQSEERLRLAMEGAGMGTFDVNLQTGKVIWSATHLRMLGYETNSGRETTIELWRSCV
jgi:PAS domain-containing protein